MSQLERLYGPEVGAPDWNVNVILLNGLKGSGRDTWTPPVGEAWWQSLSQQLGGATILSYNIPQRPLRVQRANETPLEWNAREIIDDIADRGLLNKKTIIAGYSFGGILLKGMIAEVHNGKHRKIGLRYQNIVAFAFVGVPHKGSLWATIAMFALRLFSTTNLKDASLRSRTLKDVDERFKNAVGERFRRVPVVSIIETKPVSVGTLLDAHAPRAKSHLAWLPEQLFSWLMSVQIYRPVVEKQSATTDLDTEELIEADACHLALPHFNFADAQTVLAKMVTVMRPLVEVDPAGDPLFEMFGQRIRAA